MLLWPTNGHMPCLAVDAPASVKIDKEYIRKGRHDTLSTTSKSRCRVEILVRDVLTLSGNPEDIIRWTPIAREEAEHVS